jgi:uncharacterized membrane protein
MALPDSLTAELGSLLTASWSQIVADANANGGVTNLTFQVQLTETSPPGGPMNYVIGFSHKYRTEVTQSAYERVTGTAS